MPFPPASGALGFFQQIRDRRLFQIVTGYAAAGWVVLEVSNQLIERGLLPELVFRVGFVWYLGGLIAALIVGWYHGEKGHQDISASEVSFLSLVGIGALLLTAVTVSRHLEAARAGGLAATQGSLDHRRIAVLYFEDATGTDSLAYLADGLTEALIDQLQRVPALDVLSENAALDHRESDVPLDSIARSLRAGTLVTGSVRKAGERVAVDLTIADGESGVEFRRQRLERPASDLLALSDELAREASLLLREWLGEEVALRRERGGTGSVGAWALFQRAERMRKQAEERLDHDDLHGAWEMLAAADSLASEAAALDGSWVRVPVLRAQISRRLAQMAAGDRLEAEEYLQQGIAHADQALRLDRRNAAALENRGILRYIRWALSLENDHTAAHALLEAAEADLEAAVQADRSRANAWHALSIIHAQKPDPVESKLAALRAYEEDAYLRSAPNIVWTLYTTSYDLEQLPDAIHYCEEGARRFAEDARFVECELWLLASRARVADPERAWGLLDRYVAMAPPHNREYARARGGMIVGGVLASAGLPDSADAVLRRHRSSPDIDPAREVLMFEAVFRIRMGHEDEAMRLLKTFVSASPEHREGWEWSSHWWWRPLQDNEEFRSVFRTGASHASH